jgi:hypothetical protein
MRELDLIRVRAAGLTERDAEHPRAIPSRTWTVIFAFAEAVAHYHDRNWNGQAVQCVSAPIPPTGRQPYLERCEISQGAATANWDGVWSLKAD